MFCDKVSISVKAGNGGDGTVSFLHEKFREFGGPDGGDGGKGGDIIFKVDDNVNTLYWFKTHHHQKAESGGRGKGRKKHGKNGLDSVLKVPRGTVITDGETGEIIVDLSVVEEKVVAKGGNGGFGNAHFTSSTRQAPRVAELGEPGEEKALNLELKMIADVGLVGLPNVGKSTLLSVVSGARPKIADYEFTTLIPNLGVVEEGRFGLERGFIMADIPGIIEGASEGKGLGDEFLRHIERTRLIVHILDANHSDLAEEYRIIREELRHYKVDLTDRPELVAVNKIDSISEEELSVKVKSLKKVVGKKPLILFSAIAHKNLSELLHQIELILKNTPKEKPPEAEEFKVFTMEDVELGERFEVEKVEETYVITGTKIEKFAQRTDFSNPHAVLRIRDIFKRMGIDKELRRKGAEAGDPVRILDKEFTL